MRKTHEGGSFLEIVNINVNRQPIIADSNHADVIRMAYLNGCLQDELYQDGVSN